MKVQIGIFAVGLGVGGLAMIAGFGPTHWGYVGRLLVVFLTFLAGWGLAMLIWSIRRQGLRIAALDGAANPVAGQVSLHRAGDPGDASAGDRHSLAIADLVGTRDGRQLPAYRRLERAFDALPHGVAVITEQWLISFVNAEGRALFGSEDWVIGKSVFGALSRHSVFEATERARSAGAPVTQEVLTVWSEAIPMTIAPIGQDASMLLCYPGGKERRRPSERDLSLPDQRIPATAQGPDTALIDLHAMAIDTETTGLDTKRDRVISIGGVRLHGTQMHRSATLNLLVNPDRTIPRRTIAIHGISNGMIADAPAFSSVASEVANATDGLILIGHHVAFDVRMLSNEMRRCGRKWLPGRCLDVMLIYAALFPDRRALLLEDMAKDLDVAMIGRHSALGDALTTAEIYLRLVPEVIGRGVETLAGLDALQTEGLKHLDRARRLK